MNTHHTPESSRHLTGLNVAVNGSIALGVAAVVIAFTIKLVF